MKGNVVTAESNADIIVSQVVACLVNYAYHLQHLKQMCRGVWPDCDFHQGHTHLRVLIDGTSRGRSVYINV